jgi:hypothetical protein
LCAAHVRHLPKPSTACTRRRGRCVDDPRQRGSISDAWTASNEFSIQHTSERDRHLRRGSP